MATQDTGIYVKSTHDIGNEIPTLQYLKIDTDTHFPENTTATHYEASPVI